MDGKDRYDCLQNVILDVCSLDQELTLLQQGCDITGGNYLKIPQRTGLLEYLLVYYMIIYIKYDFVFCILNYSPFFTV